GAVDEDGEPRTPVNRNRSATLNYELDRNIQHIRHAAGQVRKVSVAVVIRQRSETLPNGQVRNVALSPEEIQRITALVQGAVGFDETRGDSVQISNAPFAQAGDPAASDIPV